MKKTLLTAAVAAIALAGCVQNEIEVSSNNDAKISFSAPLVSGVTRAVTGEITNPYSTDESFVVNAKYYASTFTKWAEGQDYMTDVVAAYSDADKAWAPSDHVYYWPKTGSLTFMAYSPADFTSWKPAIGGADAESLAASAVTISDGNVDLLYSALAKDKTANDDIVRNNYKGVEIKFNHALSSIVFKVALSNALSGNAKIIVNGVKLANVNSVGNFSWTLDEDTTPEWSNHATAKEYVAVADAEQEVTIDAAKLTDANALILLPQVMIGATAEQNVVVVVNYTIVNGDGTTSVEQTSTVDLSKLTYATQATAEWQPGKRYIYTIKFGMDKILFDPEVKDWEDIEVTAAE